MREAEIATLLSVLIVGNVVIQIPLGLAAERWRPRLVLIVCAALTAIGCLLQPFLMGTPLMWVLAFCLGALSYGAYTVALVELGDRFSGPMLVAGNSAFALSWGIGSMAGPLGTGGLMDVFGIQALPLTFAVLLVVFVIVAMAASPQRVWPIQYHTTVIRFAVRAATVGRAFELSASSAAPLEPLSGLGEEASKSAKSGTSLVEQKAIYYFQGKEGEVGQAVDGTATWAEIDKDGRRAIQTTIRISERNVTVLVTIYKNYDAALPASHLVEVQFAGKIADSPIQRVPALFKAGGAGPRPTTGWRRGTGHQ